ncbi:MAG: aspartate-semialdehyde dehydrogenase [Spirochaeta sp. LUC14_002_19_P3]|nr:MAG: aspartate-semialdehyde dehydrogenase [Spirochaeta sp. LUC14_002_19_P3]
MNKKIPVGLLGATGTVGQKFIVLLQNHPWFEIKELVASTRSAGHKYADVCSWKQNTPIPDYIAGMTVIAAGKPLESPILLSGIESSAVGMLERDYAKQGHVIISNTSNHRMDSDVPIIIPEVNPDHFKLAKRQDYSGAIVTNSNCVVMPMAMALAPLHKHFGIQWVQLTSMQSISGAGYPGVSAFDIMGNVIPYIDKEEPKVETEGQKILGTLRDNYIEPADFVVSAQCNRVPVIDGHTATMSMKFRGSPPTVNEVKSVMREWRGMPQEKNLPSAPPTPLIVMEEDNRPQPLWDLLRAGGMSTCVGRVRECSIGDIKMVVMGHNTIRGAAGASILNAEAYIALGYLDGFQPV